MERNYDWNQIEQLQELSWLPDRYDIEDKKLFRSPLFLINHLMWNQLVDYNFYNDITTSEESEFTVHAYYTASIHHLHRLKLVDIPANKPFTDVITIKNYSRLREESIRQARIENCLKKDVSGPLRNYLEHLHRIPDLNQYCAPELEEIVYRGQGTVAEYDRVWAAWAIDLVLCLYREDMEGNITLVGASDYLVDSASMIYPKSNNYWVDRIREETVINRTEHHTNQQNQFRSIYIPGQNPVKIESDFFPDEEDTDLDWFELINSETSDDEK